MAKKEYWLQCTSEKKLKEFYKNLGRLSESEAYWIRFALTRFAKSHKWDIKKVDIHE